MKTIIIGKVALALSGVVLGRELAAKPATSKEILKRAQSLPSGAAAQ